MESNLIVRDMGEAPDGDRYRALFIQNDESVHPLVAGDGKFIGWLCSEGVYIPVQDPETDEDRYVALGPKILHRIVAP